MSGRSISIDASTYAKLRRASCARGESMRRIVEQAIASLPIRDHVAPVTLSPLKPACVHGWPSRTPIGPCPHCTDWRLS